MKCHWPSSREPMRKTRYSEEQIIRVLQEVESDAKVKDVCREHGIAEGTHYRWKSKYGASVVTEIGRRGGPVQPPCRPASPRTQQPSPPGRADPQRPLEWRVTSSRGELA